MVLTHGNSRPCKAPSPATSACRASPDFSHLLVAKRRRGEPVARPNSSDGKNEATLAKMHPLAGRPPQTYWLVR